MNKNSIEEDMKYIHKTLNDMKIKDEDAFMSAVATIFRDYKRVLKENEILKKEKEQAWEEWNNLEQGSYETEQKLKQQIKELRKENEGLKEERQIVGIPVRNKRDRRIGIVLHQWENGRIH